MSNATTIVTELEVSLGACVDLSNALQSYEDGKWDLAVAQLTELLDSTDADREVVLEKLGLAHFELGDFEPS